MEPDFIKICRVEDLKEKIGRQFFVNDIEIAVFKVNGKIYALSNICPHQKTHLIHEGFIENDKVYCPVHGWQFDLMTGKLAGGGKGLDVYDVKVINSYVYVKVKEKSINW